MKDQDLLADIAKGDSNKGIRKAAVEKLEDQVLLALICWNDSDEKVRKAARGRLKGQAAHANNALFGGSLDKFDALERVSEKTLLAEIAKRTWNGLVGDDAVRRIEDHILLADIAKNAMDSDVRRTAVWRVDDPDVLGLWRVQVLGVCEC